jgi:3',5'-cyclic AMP phosphodiesterase CpdA
MNYPFSRREFLQTATAGLWLGLHGTNASAAEVPTGSARAGFSFILLGDLHFDQVEHHDLDWVRREKPNDVRQIEGYCRNTREVTPALFAAVRATVADLNRTSASQAAFVMQAGDLVEGLCGREDLAVRQNRDALEFIGAAQLGAPFLFTKGNHDITGPGAAAAFGSVFHPFLSRQMRQVTPAAGNGVLAGACYSIEHGNAQFVCLDAYDTAKSLDWFEAVAAQRTAEHFFVIVHPPVVPYGARSTWHLFASPKEAARRERFLTLLGDQHALVLGGHIHRYSILSRRAGRGRFTQIALSSVLSAAHASPKSVLSGVDHYTPDQIVVEPTFSPANTAERRAVYEKERPFVDAFDYADLPGYAVVTVAGPQVTLQMHPGTSRTPWRTVNLTAVTRS